MRPDGEREPDAVDPPPLPVSEKVPEQAEAEPRRRFERTRGYLARFGMAGLTGALIFFCLSLTPSLLPRVWYMQALMSGITAAIGYGIGALIGWLLRSIIGWRPGAAARRGARWALAIATLVLIPLFGVLGARWQHEIRQMVDATQPSEARYVLVEAVALLVMVALISVARGVRLLTRLVARQIGRVIPKRAATAIAVIVVFLVLGFLATGVLPRAALSLANSVFGSADNSTAAGVTQPSVVERSGGPESLVPWQTLGRQGRTFVAGGPTTAQISAFTGTPATEPIRVYVGLKSATSIAAESALAVRELDRTGAFSRKVLIVATTTGTGWVNPTMIDPVEYMYGGDTAAVAIQYSYLPSWISFVASKAPPQEAGRDLFNAVYDRWNQLPANHRPKLVVLGESLGSFGGEAAFSGIEDIRDRTSGVLWVGPTNSNTLWSRFVSGRDPGSPAWQPLYEGGKTVRFAINPAKLDTTGWGQPRVLYLQHASDPIVWWSWQLAFNRPDWLRGTYGPDVSTAMRWYPLVTFWQVVGDLALSTAVPAGHGHTYGIREGAYAWAAIIPPPGWTTERTTALATRPAN